VLARASVAVVVAGATIGLTATTAFAHATLVSSSPAQSAVYPAGGPPASVSLEFDEAVTATPSSVNVYDGSGRSVHAGAPHRTVTSRRIAVTLPRLADGSYVVVWHIVSDDGHPEQGVLTFGVGKGGVTTADVGGLLARQSSGRDVGFLFGVDRAVAFLACLILVGGLLFTRWFWPDALERQDLRRLLVSAGVVAIAATLLSIPLQAGYTTVGGLSKTLDGAALRTVLSARFGRAALVRAGLLLGLVAFVRPTSPRTSALARRSNEAVVAILALGVWASFTYAGHGNTGHLVGLGFVTDLTHLGGASVWLGGLVALAFALRDRQYQEANRRAAAGFSKVALPAIGVLVLSGVVQGWRQINTWWALWHTAYGRLLVIKVLLVVAIIVVASASRDLVRDQLIPSVRGALPHGSSRLASEDDAVTELRNSIWVEVLLAGVVLAVTASLVVTAPGREAAAAVRQPVARTVHVAAAGQHMTYSVLLQPAVPGANTIVVTPRLVAQTGFLPFGISGLVQGPGKAGPLRVRFTPLEDGRWVAAAPLSKRGNWRLDLVSDASPITDTTSVQLPIG